MIALEVLLARSSSAAQNDRPSALIRVHLRFPPVSKNNGTADERRWTQSRGFKVRFISAHVLFVFWYRLAALQSYAPAQNNLAVMYMFGKAANWYQLAAEQGHLNAQNNLGLMYIKGRGMPKDHKQAAKWLQLAAASPMFQMLKDQNERPVTWRNR